MAHAPRSTASDPLLALSLTAALGGFVIFTVGARPEWLGLATTPEVGFLQILFMTVGMGLLSAAGYLAFRVLWRGEPLSIAAQIGGRLIATGYVVVAASTMADILGLGSQTWPRNAHFGPIQSYGVLIGEFIIGVGLLLLYPRKRAPSS